MAVSEVQVETTAEEYLAKKSLLASAWDLARSKPLGTAGALRIFVMAFVAIFADVITGYDPVKNHFADMPRPPGGDPWFGPDQFGRDLPDRIISGQRTALFGVTVHAFICPTVCLVLSVVSSYLGGKPRT